MRCLLVYCRARPEHVQVLYDLLAIFVQRTLVDFSFLRRFFASHVARCYSVPNRRRIVRLFVQVRPLARLATD